jgi:tetratricopeptide (TPR) repeat protein
VTRSRVGPLALFGLVTLSFVGGCPLEKPPVTPAATVKETDLPGDRAQLLEYADRETRVETVESLQNAIKALERADASGKTYDTEWRLARAYARLCDQLEDTVRCEELSLKGVTAAREAVAADGARVEGQYYLGTTLGQYAFVKKLKAKELVPQLLEAARAAVKADERYDYAGPLRLLGSVYAQAPEPPTSVGDHDEGIKLLTRAIRLAGAYPQNHLLLADAHVINRDLDLAEREYQKVLEMQPPPGVAWANRYAKWREKAEQGLRRVNNLRRQNASERGAPF